MNKNEIVARFMGLKENGLWVIIEGRKYSIQKKHFPRNLRYNSKYDWLMPAWVKFRDLKFDDSKLRTKHKTFRLEICHAINYCEITEAFDELVKGIEWYNSLRFNNPENHI